MAYSNAQSLYLIRLVQGIVERFCLGKHKLRSMMQANSTSLRYSGAVPWSALQVYSTSLSCDRLTHVAARACAVYSQSFVVLQAGQGLGVQSGNSSDCTLTPNHHAIDIREIN